MILVVDVVQCLNDLLEAGDELMLVVELQQRPTELPVYDGRIKHQVMASTDHTTNISHDDILIVGYVHFSLGYFNLRQLSPTQN